MRSLHNPGSVFKALVSSFTAPVQALFGGGDKKPAAPQVSSPAEDKAASEEKARKAAEETRSAAGARTGSSSTLLSPQTDVSLLSTRRRTLGSS